MLTVQELFPLEAYSGYLDYARRNSYCDPFMPYVGENYDAGELPKLAYCGVAARWDEKISRPGSARDLWEKEIQWSKEFVREHMTTSAFWGLFNDVLEKLDTSGKFTKAQRHSHAVWTNLSKLGLPEGVTAPPSKDLGLRRLDSAQIQREIEILSPDLFLCVSGSSLVPTANEAFSSYPEIDFESKNAGTIIKSLPNGGVFYWTGHPNFKTNIWWDEVKRNIVSLLKLPEAPQGRAL